MISKGKRSTHSTTDYSESDSGLSDITPRTYNHQEWKEMRSPSRVKENSKEKVEQDLDNDIIFFEEEEQQNEMTVSHTRLEHTADTCLPTLLSPMEWLKESLRTHSPSFLWSPQRADHEQRHSLFFDKDEEATRDEICFDSPTVTFSKPIFQLPQSPPQEESTSSSGVLIDPPPPPPSPTDSKIASSDVRVIAPHVDLLSLGSVVEILIMSEMESIAVLCSVDVLKMHSQSFQIRLQAQEAEASELKLATPLDEVCPPDRNTSYINCELCSSKLLRCGAAQ